MSQVYWHQWHKNKQPLEKNISANSITGEGMVCHLTFTIIEDNKLNLKIRKEIKIKQKKIGKMVA
jgi:hypothetical protein